MITERMKQLAGVDNSLNELEVVGSFTKEQLDTLRKEYSKIKRIDPTSKAYQIMISLLDSLNAKQLKQILDANIPWLSTLARNRLR